MDMTRKFQVRSASWHEDRATLRDLRHRVFVVEQGVPEELEWDDADAGCMHVLALDEHNRPIGTGRLLPDGQIGRMAVLPQWRRRGVGSAILEFLLDRARERGLAVYLNAQTQAVGFYARHGLVAQGEEFMDAGIPHRRMTFSR